jgi:lysozyme
MTETLSHRIQRHEGIRLTPYRDTLGHWTIGCGHEMTECQAQGYVNGISEAEALDLLTADIANAQALVSSDLPWVSQLSELRREVLVEMVFQLGMDGLLGFHDMLFDLRSGNYAEAASAMLDSEWHKETPGRCEELASIMRNDAEAYPPV